MNVLIGSDPEIFAMQGGKYVSAHGLIPGDKKNPHPVKDGAVQVDGMALEFNTNPAATEDEFVHNLDSVMGQLRAMVPDHALAPVPVADFGREYIQAQPDEAKELGCDPDFNAYTGAENPVPDVDAPFRTGSGHIHVGLWKPGADPVNGEEVTRQFVREMDAVVGISSVLYDGDKQRRQLYGQAGAYRYKPYGFEYRVLSNVWLSSEELQRFVYKATLKACDNMRRGGMLSRRMNARDIINKSSVQRAKLIVEQYSGYFPQEVMKYVG